MDMKKQLQRRLVANVLMDKCASREHLIFKDSLCIQDRVIRFTTVWARRFFPVSDITAGRWKTGDEMMYEVENGVDSCVVNCVYDPIASAAFPKGILKSWGISDSDTNALFDSFDTLLDKTIPLFERELEVKLKKEELTEGDATVILTTKYERNPKARAACLEHYGYHCKICGMSFAEAYGPEFKNIIEVHHIVPISEIGESYVVDPIKDLIPVCPNCHAMIHRKIKNDALVN